MQILSPVCIASPGEAGISQEVSFFLFFFVLFFFLGGGGGGGGMVGIKIIRSITASKCNWKSRELSK